MHNLLFQQRNLRYILFIILLSSLGIVYPAAGQDIDSPLKMTVNDILLDQKNIDGRVVHITGTFNECISYTCELCDAKEPVDPHTEENQYKCVGVSFIDRNLEKLARFSTVTVQGTYDSACSKIPESDDIRICTDRATELDNSIILEVITYRSPIEGHISTYGTEKLAAVSASERKALIKAFKESLPSFNDIEDEQVYFAYKKEVEEDIDILKKGDYGFYPIGGVCVCFDEPEMCKKPTLSGHTFLESAEQNYFCYSAEKQQGKWRFIPS